MAGLREVIENKGLLWARCTATGNATSSSLWCWKGKRWINTGRRRWTCELAELGVQMIAAYSPQARGRSERSFGTWQGRLPQELRLAGIATVDGANAFLRERYMGEFNQKFSMSAEQKGTAFRRTSRRDLNWIFTVQTERVVAKDNTVAIAARSWQIDKTHFRHTLAGCTVTIHEHLDGTLSIRYGPHVVGQFEANGERRGKVQSPPKARPSHFPTATTATALSPKLKRQAARAA